MATGRALVVHESSGTRSLLTELLTREGFSVEALDSPYECIARVVDEPADLVLLGLSHLQEAELEVIRSLKDEEAAPRVLVTFPSPLRDLAVRALTLGADGYVLEPFYTDEVIGLVRGQTALKGVPEPNGALSHLAAEVAHAVNNPLQVLTLLLQKDRVTKKELLEGVPAHLDRIEAVVGHLRDFASVGVAHTETRDVRPLVERAAADAGMGYDAADVPLAQADPTQYATAIEALLGAIRARARDEELSVSLGAEETAVALRVAVPRDAFADENVAELLDDLFVVLPGREVFAGFARVRLLLERQGGSLVIEQKGDRLVFVARVPLA